MWPRTYPRCPSAGTAGRHRRRRPRCRSSRPQRPARGPRRCRRRGRPPAGASGVCSAATGACSRGLRDTSQDNLRKGSTSSGPPAGAAGWPEACRRQTTGKAMEPSEGQRATVPTPAVPALTRLRCRRGWTTAGPPAPVGQLAKPSAAQSDLHRRAWAAVPSAAAGAARPSPPGHVPAPLTWALRWQLAEGWTQQAADSAGKLSLVGTPRPSRRQRPAAYERRPSSPRQRSTLPEDPAELRSRRPSRRRALSRHP
mmetsp:Transcript_83843/g.241063  ORF Transcript_83843/g.241063 Transcript_83843/m.241063 type:complete len:255 (-) Transcript_83843:333-1097(-)